MPFLTSKTFEHAGRTFEIRAEISDTDPGHLEAVVYLDGALAWLPYPEGEQALPTYGASFSRNLGPGDRALAAPLMAAAEADFRRLLR
ncbi:hypothetical protein [Caulobacter sp. RL271]|uniref:Uncharacterized protein n=1 Tax=Caulobacter segnis TaxID=88688 RepID=A0ABY4ZR71_9CAUL|nr:hypothetical protein [Caulobacter segnis]USQ95303.1 hypothetical protein MZV50_22575 [Caulobacter segnis]